MDDQKTHKIYNPYSAAFFMAAISGFSDVFGFISLDHLFTAHITGNIVIIIAFIIFKTHGIASKVIAIPLFILFAAAISSVIETHGLTKKSLCFWLLFEVVLFTALLIFGVYAIPNLSVTSWAFIAISMLPVCAMAIHNTLLRTYLPTLPPCTVMTGNLTQLIVDLTTYAIAPKHKTHINRDTALRGIKKFGNAIAGFILGGLLSTFGYIWFHFFGILFIIGLLLIMTTISFLATKNSDETPDWA